MKVVVTGGAGYIGSIVVDRLIARGDMVHVLDDFSTGHRDAVNTAAHLHPCDLRDRALVADLAATLGAADAIVHLAAHSIVSESMRDPVRTIGDNLAMQSHILALAQRVGARHFVFASTASVYGEPRQLPIRETDELAPTSPYGESKLAGERLLAWAQRATGINVGILRFMNVAGASATRRERHEPETHLVPLVLDVALGKAPELKVFGDDYGTPDGTAVRDYVDVEDLADAHVALLSWLEDNPFGIFNVGLGRGVSVLEVLDAARRVTGHPIPTQVAARRPGDPAELWADTTQIQERLGWVPRRTSIDAMIASVWRHFSAR